METGGITEDLRYFLTFNSHLFYRITAQTVLQFGVKYNVCGFFYQSFTLEALDGNLHNKTSIKAKATSVEIFLDLQTCHGRVL